MLEKIKELRVKAECAKALLALADDETERKHFKKLLDKYKQELLKFLDEPQPKPSRNEPQEPKRLSAILADNQTDLNAIDDENTNPLFDELAEQKGANYENIACYVLVICKLREHKKDFAKLIFSYIL